MIEVASLTHHWLHNEIVKLYKDGLSQTKIAHLLNISDTKVSTTLTKFNIERRSVINRTKIYESYEQEIIDLYGSGESTQKIAEKFNISKTTVLDCLKRNGIKRRENNGDLQRKYTLNHNYFNSINTPSKAYILGFIFADGSISEKDNRLTIGISEKDEEILNFIQKEFESDYQLYYRKEKNNRQPSKILAICSKQIIADLISYGCVQNKTFKAKFPLNIPTEFYKDFVRGYFDGDGYVSKTSNRIEIVGTEELLLEIANQVYLDSKMTYSKLRTRHPERNHNIRILIYYGPNKFNAFKNYIYKDPESFGLFRKKNKFIK